MMIDDTSRLVAHRRLIADHPALYSIVMHTPHSLFLMQKIAFPDECAAMAERRVRVYAASELVDLVGRTRTNLEIHYKREVK